MPTAEISDKAHKAAKDHDGTIGDAVDMWHEMAGMLDGLRLVDDEATLHKAQVTPYGRLEAECQKPHPDPWTALGAAEAKDLIGSGDLQTCEVCENE